MSKTLILYSSLTGNTEMMTKEIIEQLNHQNIEFVKKDFNDESIDVRKLLNYDIIFIGVYTWSLGDVPLEVEDFYDNLYDLDLSGKVCGVFGSADIAYGNEYFGTAVNMIYEQLEKLGATMISDRIIVDLEPSKEELERCRKLVDAAYKMAK